jgi:hypothetical protein
MVESKKCFTKKLFIMINPFDYLYYKIYSALSYISGGGNPINHIGAIILLFILNCMNIYTLITGELSATFAYISGFLILIVSLIYFYSRQAKIIAKYSQESEQSRTIGNTAVVLYVIISIVAAVLVIRANRP